MAPAGATAKGTPVPASRVTRIDRSVLLAVALAAAAALLFTPGLIVPFPDKAPWYESAAMFPRVALGLAVLGAVAEVWVRRTAPAQPESDELDSSTVRVPLALAMLALFVAYAVAVPVLGYLGATLIYLVACGGVLRLPWRRTLLLAVPLAIALWVVFVAVLKVAFGHGWWV